LFPNYTTVGRRDRCYCPYVDTVDEEHYAFPAVTVQDMCVFLAFIVHMGYDLRDKLKDY